MTFDRILGFIEGGAAATLQIAAGTPVGAAAGVADFFLKLIQAGVRGHEAVTGKRFDPALLHHIDPVQ